MGHRGAIKSAWQRSRPPQIWARLGRRAASRARATPHLPNAGAHRQTAVRWQAVHRRSTRRARPTVEVRGQLSLLPTRLWPRSRSVAACSAAGRHGEEFCVSTKEVPTTMFAPWSTNSWVLFGCRPPRMAVLSTALRASRRSGPEGYGGAPVCRRRHHPSLPERTGGAVGYDDGGRRFRGHEHLPPPPLSGATPYARAARVADDGSHRQKRRGQLRAERVQRARHGRRRRASGSAPPPPSPPPQPPETPTPPPPLLAGS